MPASATQLERNYQSKLIDKIYKLLPDCEVLKNDSGYRQGILDLTVFNGPRYGLLEVKRKYPRSGTNDFEPNQEWYVERFNQMGFAAVIYPANEKEVLRELYIWLTDY